jgi:O-antigen/teichoic acid export membrane protein
MRIGYSLCQPAMTAIGRPYLSAIASGAAAIARIALIFLLGARDVMTFAIALLFADLITAPVPALLMAKYLGYSVRDSVVAHLSSLLVATVCAIVSLLMDFAMPQSWPDALRLALVGVVLTPTWIASVLLLKHPLRSELPALLGKVLPQRLVLRLNKYHS